MIFLNSYLITLLHSIEPFLASVFGFSGGEKPTEKYRFIFKELAHGIVGAGVCEMCRVGRRAAKSGKN